MRKARVKMIAFAVAATFVIGPSRADIGSSLDMMWYSSAGGTVSGSNGVGIYGPSLSLRSPSKNYQIAYFDPPRFSAGCHGIDVTFGAFSMLAGSQFKDLIRKIMQAAPGFLMELAIKAMCEDCWSVMRNLHNLANMINSAQINSCKVSQQLFTAISSDVGSKDGAENTKAQLESYSAAVNNYASDLWKASQNLFTGGDKANRSTRENDTTDYGNTFVNTYYTAGAQNKMDFAIFGSEKEGMQIMQSLIGTTVIRKSSANTGDNGASQDDLKLSATLSFDDLVNGKTDHKVSYYKCRTFVSGDPDTCQEVERDAAYEYVGIKRYLIEKFAGNQDPDGNDPSVVTTLRRIDPNSIMGKYRRGDYLTTQEIDLLRKLPVNLQRIMAELQQLNEAESMHLYNAAFSIIADQITAAITMSIVNTVKSAYTPTNNAVKVVPMSEEQKARLYDLERTARAKLNDQERAQRIYELSAQIKEARSYSGKAFASK